MAPYVRRSARFAAATALASGWALTAFVATAQSPANPAPVTSGRSTAAQPQQAKDRMVVDARELVYDNDKNTVSAVGDVQILYQGRTIEADRVVYDRAAKRVVATGNARITEANGTVITGDRFNLTDDFRDGFVDSLRVVNPDKTRFTAPRAERTDGETFIFDKGIYTACEPCKDDPEKPPLWQVRAQRIIHKKSEQMIYYENAQVEFGGIPLAYVPYMSAPDATVKRKTGVLAPRFVNTNALGFGAGVPYFFNLAPNYDVTVTPTYLSRQGLLGEVEWRHRLVNGSYNIRAAGIFQQEKEAFLDSPLGAGNKEFRGSLETAGKFFINQRWNFGWDVAMTTDRWFFKNYRIRSESLTSSFLQESTSTVYLNGKSDTAWFDLRGYHFQPLTYADWQKQQPLVTPVLDYNKRFHNAALFGGEFALDLNATHISREAAAFQQIPVQSSALLTTPDYALYDGCAVYRKGECLVRGLAGNIARVTAEASWRRTFIDPIGQVWTPYASLRGDILSVNPRTTGYFNNNVTGIVDVADDSYGRVMPAIGLTYRYPFVATTSWGTHTIEPIAQIVARPNETHALRVANEDAQSLIFDDTNLFEWNKFSGYDRVEGGTRANLGALYTGNFGKDRYANLLVGQSFQLSGRNPYTTGDLLNTGVNSGLDTRRSDYVIGAQLAPIQGLLLSGRGRFDETDFSPKRLDASLRYSVGPITAGATYARYERQPEIGQGRRREGLNLNGSYLFTQYWRVRGGVLFDMDKYIQDRQNFQINYASFLANPTGVARPVYPKSNLFETAQMSLGLNYTDECTVFDVSYTRTFADKQSGTTGDSQVVLLRLELRTLGEVSYSQNLGNGSTSDGIRTN